MFNQVSLLTKGNTSLDSPAATVDECDLLNCLCVALASKLKLTLILISHPVAGSGAFNLTIITNFTFGARTRVGCKQLRCHPTDLYDKPRKHMKSV